jgi:hypothetical protein
MKLIPMKIPRKAKVIIFEITMALLLAFLFTWVYGVMVEN